MNFWLVNGDDFYKFSSLKILSERGLKNFFSSAYFSFSDLWRDSLIPEEGAISTISAGEAGKLSDWPAAEFFSAERSKK